MRTKKTISLLLAAAMTYSLVCAGCGKTDTAGNTAEGEGTEDVSIYSEEDAESADESLFEDYQGEHVTIAVATYSTTDAEVLAFKDYYVNYIAKNFDVDFLYSEGIMDAEAEIAFIEQAAAAGCKGYIAFTTLDLATLVEKCESYGMYVIMGAGQNSGFDAVKDNPYFLGCTGPTMDAEYEAGAAMAQYFAEQDTQKDGGYLIISGGGAMANDMHAERTRAMIETLADIYGFEVPSDMESYTRATETKNLDTGDSGIEVTIYPLYPMDDSWYSGAAQLISTGEYDYVMNVLAPSAVASLIDEAEKALGMNILHGTVDCFTSDEEAMFHTMDSTGNESVNFLAGKYGSIVGVAFAVMYNAITGNADLYRVDGSAFSIYQGYWYATSKEEFDEYYNLAVNPECIAYNIEDLKSVIKVYNPDADYETMEKLASDCTVNAVKERRGIE